MGVLRFLLAACVVLYHCPPGVINRYLHSGLAVQCFYVISGFLIQLVIASYSRRETANWKLDFYQSRLLRLMPLYWLFTLLTLAVFGNRILTLLWNDKDVFGLAVFFFNNLFILGQDMLRLTTYNVVQHGFHFMPPETKVVTTLLDRETLLGSNFSILSQSWSLAVEMLFYLSAPFILLRRTPVLLAIIAASVCFRVWLAGQGYVHNFYMHGIILNEIAIFLLGALACRFYRFALAEGRLRRVFLSFLSEKAGESLLTAGGAALAAGMVFYYFMGWRMYPHGGQWGEGFFPVPYAWWGVLFFTAATIPFIFHATGRWKWDRFIGDLSYPLYISHVFFVEAATRYAVPEEWRGAVVLGASTVVSVFLALYIDRPVDALRHKLFRRSANLSAPASFRKDIPAAVSGGSATATQSA